MSQVNVTKHPPIHPYPNIAIHYPKPVSFGAATPTPNTQPKKINLPKPSFVIPENVDWIKTLKPSYQRLNSPKVKK